MRKSTLILFILSIFAVIGLSACDSGEPDAAHQQRDLELNQKLADVSKQLVQTTKTSTEADALIIELRQRVAQLEKQQLEKQGDAGLDKEALQQQIDMAAAKGESMQQQLADYLMQMEEREKALLDSENKRQQSASELDTVKRLEATANLENSALVQQLANATQAAEKLLEEQVALNQALEEAKKSLSTANQKVNDVSGQYQQLFSEKNLLTLQTTSEMNNVKREHEMARDEISSLNQKITDSDSKIQKAMDEQKRRDDKFKVSKQALLMAEREATEIDAQYRTMLVKNRSLESSDDESKNELNRLREELESSQQKVAGITEARGIYTVQSLDSLSSIAAFFYRDGNQWRAIWKANEFLLETPDLIYSGMVLVIPRLATLAK
jgi:nucleoid-associated protein YgaU